MLFHSVKTSGLFLALALTSVNALVIERAADATQSLVCTKGVSFVLNSSYSFEQWKRSSNPVVIADLDGDGIDELINLGTQGQISDYPTGTTHKLGSLAQAPVASPGPRVDIRFADLNGDGKQDYIVLNDTTGDVQAWINNGPGSFIPWTNLGQIFTTPKDLGGPAVEAWLNKGYTGGPANNFFGASASAPSTLQWHWQYESRIFHGAGAQANSRFADINGDGLADYLLVDATNGSVSASQNLGPDHNSFIGWAWGDPVVIEKGLGYSGSQVHLGPFSGTNRSDYVVIPSSGSPLLYQSTCKK